MMLRSMDTRGQRKPGVSAKKIAALRLRANALLSRASFQIPDRVGISTRKP